MKVNQTTSPPRFSILTTTRNRDVYLPRIAAWLSLQDMMDFEWIIGDDGSGDQTTRVVESLFSKFKFNGKYIKSSSHVGKSSMDNYLLDMAVGEYLLWCDSDEFLASDALKSISNVINDYSTQVPSIIVGKIASVEGRSINIQDSGFNVSTCSSIEEMPEAFRGKDCLIIFNRKLFQDKRFPIVDFYMPESTLFQALFNRPFVLLNMVLKYGDYLSDGITRGSGEIRYPRGLWLSMARALIKFPKNLTACQKQRIPVFLFRMGTHGEVPNRITFATLSRLGFPRWRISLYEKLGYLLILKDLLSKKVRRTHLDCIIGHFDHHVIVTNFIAGSETEVFSISNDRKNSYSPMFADEHILKKYLFED